MFKKLSSMLTELENAKGKNAKGELLKKFVGDKHFRWMADAALSQGFSYGVKEFPDFVQQPVVAGDLEVAQLITSCRDAKGVSDADLFKLWQAACSSPEHYKVVTRILRKDLRCGCGADSMNKAMPRIVFKTPYQRCGKSDKVNTMTYPALLQRKANGMFSYSMPDGSFMTRQGNRYTIPGCPVTQAHKLNEDLYDMVLIQELVVLDEKGKVLSRAVGNGIINSFIKGEGEPQYADKIRSFCWGFLTVEEFNAGLGTMPYSETYDKLCECLPEGEDSAILPIESWPVNSFAEAQAKANELIAGGEEGGVLKSLSPDFVWRDEETCNFQFKMKSEADAEFEIVDAYYGEPGKKYEKFLGGIKVRSCDQLIASDCGGGFSDEQRKLGVDYWKAQAGKIVTLRFNGITTAEDTDLKTLDHPRLVETRFTDKTVADSLDYCQKALLGRI